MHSSNTLQSLANDLYSKCLTHLGELSAIKKLSTVRLNNQIVFQYFSENNKEIIDTIDFCCGGVTLKNDMLKSVPRYIKLKELSSQDMIHVISCIEKGEYDILPKE